MATSPNKKNVNDKKPLQGRDDPFARDPRGKATREEIRKITPVVHAPRQPQGTPKRA